MTRWRRSRSDLVLVPRYARLLRVQLAHVDGDRDAVPRRLRRARPDRVPVVGADLIPLLVVFGVRQQVAGWSFPEALVVVGWFTLLRAVLEGAVSPSLTAVVEHVRKGTLDFVLLKPADAQFLVSTAKFEPWRVVDVVGAFAMFVLRVRQARSLAGAGPRARGRWCSWRWRCCVLYSIWILVVSAAFWVVKVDNLSYLFGSLFDVGRWPISVFKGALRFVFTFVFPIALMTTYPALALLGRMDAQTAILALLGGVAFAAVARRVWKRALGMYTSASS